MDDIQRKLALIDTQLRPAHLHKRIVSTSPLLFPAIGLIAGTIAQCALSTPNRSHHDRHFVWMWLIVAALGASAALWAFVCRKKGLRPHILAYIALACFACLGAVRMYGFNTGSPNDIRNLVGEERKLATIRGLVLSDPYREDRQWYFAHLTYSDPSSGFYMRLTGAKTATGWTEVTGIVRVWVDEPVLDIKAGDQIQAYCWLERLKGPTNPGQFNLARYMARKGVFVGASVASRDSIEVSDAVATATFIRFKRALRQLATQALLGELDVEGQDYALLQALTLGYRTQIDSRTYSAFQETGLLHFVSLSGMNFAMVIAGVWWLSKTAGLMKPARALVCLVAAGVFLLVVPPNSPAVRAAIMTGVFCASFMVDRRSNPFNALSLAAIILLLIRPTYLFDADWQLSFGAVLGILLLARPIELAICERIGRLHSAGASQRNVFVGVLRGLTTAAMKALAVSLAAWLATAGIQLYYFGTINYLTPIWTVIAAPLVTIVSMAGYLKMSLSLLLPHTAGLLDFVIVPSAKMLIWVVNLIGSWNISHILIGQVPAAIVLSYYAFISFVFFAHFKRPLAKRITCAAVAVVIIAVLVGTKWHRSHGDTLILTCLDVGHGQAVLAQLPGKTNVLFDAGSLDRSNIGRRIVGPFLNHTGIDRIDAVVIGHNDVDHINGIPEIIEDGKVGGIYANDTFFAEADGYGAAGLLNRYINDKGLAVKSVNELPEFSVEAHITRLWPERDVLAGGQHSENDLSLVCSIDFAGVRVLLCSDIEKPTQRELLQKYPEIKADIVIAPHHGSVSTLDADFLDSLSPDIVICSCGRARYQNRQVLATTRTGRMFSTAEHGAITVRIDKDGSIKTTAFVR